MLWFVVSTSGTRYFRADEAGPSRKRVERILADVLGIDEQEVRNHPSVWEGLGADSLDMVELVMELEIEFD